MEIFRITRNAWGQETLEGVSWDLLPLAITVGVVVAIGHLAWRHRHPPRVPAPGGDHSPITRHAPIDRLFHWVSALAVLLLMGSAFLPILGMKFSWLPLHWITGVVLTIAVLFHLVRSTFFRRLRCMVFGPRDIRDAIRGRLAAKYTLAQKLMHAALGTAVLVATVTGVVMLAKVDTPLWARNPYLLDASTWGVIYVLHGASALVCLALTMAHVYFSLLPEKRAYLRAMIGGQLTRAEAAQFHDPQRWSGQRKDDPRENHR
jgi:cytochrome b subunit of formate dehydrogenase